MARQPFAVNPGTDQAVRAGFLIDASRQHALCRRSWSMYGRLRRRGVLLVIQHRGCEIDGASMQGGIVEAEAQ
jgi:hypothetical protein